jgi:hypothetical protein
MTAKMSVITRIGVVMVTLTTATQGQTGDQGWISLFDGTFNGWKAAAKENATTFTIKDGAIVAHGQRCHLFYVGPIHYADFRDFELKVDVMAEAHSNGGIYFHTQYQDRNWPDKGFEVQVCSASYKGDPRKTGSLYKVQDVNESLVGDNEWFTMHVIVQGRHVVVNVNDKQVVDWTETQPPKPPSDMPGASSTAARSPCRATTATAPCTIRISASSRCFPSWTTISTSRAA